MKLFLRNLGPLSFWLGLVITGYVIFGLKGVGIALVLFAIVCAL